MPLDDNSLLLNPKTNTTSTGLDGKGKILVGRVVNIFLEEITIQIMQMQH